MKTKNIVLLLTLLVAFIIVATSCKKDDDAGCIDKTLLINKWWYNVTPASGTTTYPSYYYNTNGRLKSKDQDGTGELYIGTWTMTDACKMLDMVDSTNLFQNYTEEVLEVTAHTLKVKDTWAGLGSFTEEYRDTP
jgi:hypothetical protein